MLIKERSAFHDDTWDFFYRNPVLQSKYFLLAYSYAVASRPSRFWIIKTWIPVHRDLTIVRKFDFSKSARKTDLCTEQKLEEE